MIRPALFLAFFVAASASFAELPRMLVVQRKSHEFGQEATPLKVFEHFAKEMAEDGRVKVISWTTEDPIFNRALEGMHIVDDPTDEEINMLAKKLEIKYTFICEATRVEAKLHPRAELFMTGRRGTIWTSGPRSAKESVSEVVTINGRPDWENSAKSLAHTWSQQLILGPLKDLVSGSATNFNPGEVSLTGITIDAAAGKEAMDHANKLIESGRADMAILYLKDAIDINPFEPERRIKLMELLSDQGLYELAADEGRRAARLSIDHPELWLYAAKSWVAAGKPEEAKADINEALARGVNTPLTHQLLGDIALIAGDYSKARDEYSISLEKGSTLKTQVGLALAFALDGKADQATAMLEKTKQPENGLTESDYAFVIDLCEGAIKPVIKVMADLPPRIRTGREKEATIRDAASVESKTKGMAAIIAWISPSKRHLQSQGSRDLAHKLLNQSAQEILSFAKGTDPDSGAEAVLSLGEALKELSHARETYRIERLYGEIPKL